MGVNQVAILVILILQLFLNGFAVNHVRKRQRQFGNHQSPLDAENEGRHHEFNGNGFNGNGFNGNGFNGNGFELGPEVLIPDQIALDKLPECQHECNTAFGNAMKVALQAGNHHERFLGVCSLPYQNPTLIMLGGPGWKMMTFRHYNESIVCHNKLVACPGRESFDIMTSGLYYMCIDRRRAFDKVIDCLDTRSNEVQSECENECKGQTRISEWAAKSGMLNVLSRSEKVLRDFEPEQLRSMMHEACELAKCYLTCVRNIYNTKCGENAGTLLSEAIVRPLAESQADPFMKQMSVFMYPFVPQQCSFFVKEDELSTHRIDPKIDNELRRQAEEEDRLAREAAMNATSSQFTNSTENTNMAAVRDAGNFDPIDIGEKWGLDIENYNE